MTKGKGRLAVLSDRGQMISACIAKKRGIGRGSAHNFSPTQVLERSRKLSKDEMILRLGHLSEDRMRKLVDSKSLEVDNSDNLRTCESCLKRKMTKKPFVGQSTLASGLLDLIYTDVYGSLNTPARGGYSYFITFTNDHSRYGYVYLMRYKSEAFGKFKEFRLEVENQTDRKIRTLRSNRGGQYLSGNFDYLKENGILSQ
ncbi:UNVERIFIED_CONTAM: hypothetical protein Slati_3757100 [Sesamum latifolium]|uniref:GAG-pre-integrase domain-containing protein n=1 Tax=Sesamum latifolium TaxID=2727402 RepID=A0AAW2U425_9LAMI